MGVGCNILVKNLALGLALYGACIANTFAISVEPLSYEQKTERESSLNGLPETSHHRDKTSIYHSSAVLSQNKNFALIDSTKEEGQLFFEMGSRHSLASEASAVALLILGCVGFFSRRWS